MRPVDETDLQILSLLQEDARSTYTSIASRLGMSSVAVKNRVNKMTESGLIKGFNVDIDTDKLGFGVKAFIGLKIEKLADHCPSMHMQLSEFPEVRELHHVAGDFDIILKVYARDNLHFKELLFEKIPKVSGFSRLTPIIILETSINKSGIPLDDG